MNESKKSGYRYADPEIKKGVNDIEKDIEEFDKFEKLAAEEEILREEYLEIQTRVMETAALLKDNADKASILELIIKNTNLAITIGSADAEITQLQSNINQLSAAIAGLTELETKIDSLVRQKSVGDKKIWS